MLTIPQYIIAARQFECDYSNVSIDALGLRPHNAARLVHAALGLTTEVLELLEAIKKNDHQSQIEELGDIAWFAAIAHFTDVSSSNLKYERIESLMYLCERFASNIKAGVFYGNPVLKSDTSPTAWRQLPESILYCTQAIAHRHGISNYLDVNIEKLTVRNRGKKHNVQATIQRDPKAEAAAIAATLEGGNGPLKLADESGLASILLNKINH